jgi:hypothetical protein
VKIAKCGEGRELGRVGCAVYIRVVRWSEVKALVKCV